MLVLILKFLLPAMGQEPTIWLNEAGAPLHSAMAGGFLAPQFSSFDLNQDGIAEIISFDRYSGIIQVWETLDHGSTYQLSADQQIDWPIARSWMMVRDFDRDGIPDVFTQGLHGIAVYQGYLDGNQIRFQSMSGPSFIDDSLLFQNRSGRKTNIYHAHTDIPIIEDVDGDGDLDILTFELSGSYLYFYENRSSDNGQELDFTLAHSCWGYFAENLFSEEINLSQDGENCPPPFTVRHAGSTSCMIDLNRDSIPDLLLGDIGTNTLKMLLNSGTAEKGHISRVEGFFPDSTDPVFLNYFPAAYRIDVNQDDIPDLILAVNEFPANDAKGVHIYTGTDDQEKPFILSTDNWLRDQMIDLGQYASPCFMDVNGDGFQDILVAYQISNKDEAPVSKIALWEAYSEAEYRLADLDYMNLSTYLEGHYRFYLTTGDIDNDGDNDILAGTSDGNAFLIRNGSGASGIFELEKVEKDWAGLKMLSGATPELFDIDGDGDLDVVAGFDNGTIGLYRNTGNRINALFEPDSGNQPDIQGVGEIRTIGENSLLGRSAPRILTTKSDTLLVSGSHHGELYVYRINTHDLNASFPRIYPEDWPEWIGGNGRLAIHQVDDVSTRLIAGNIAGGLTENVVSLTPTASTTKDIIPLAVYPNPIRSGQGLKWAISDGVIIERIRIYAVTGKIISTFSLSPGHDQISTQGWTPGLYFMEVINRDGGSTVVKVIVM